MTARDQGLEELALPDMERRLANMVRYGTVDQVDTATRRVKIKTGDITTDWVAWSAGRAGAGKRRWDAPEVGEQVVMLSPTGDLRQACILPGVYRQEHDAPVSDANKDHVTYGDGTTIEYDRASHTLKADLGDSSLTMTRTAIVLTIGATTLTMTAANTTLETPALTVDSPASTFTGAVTIQGLLTYAAGLTGSGGAGASMTGNLTVTGGDISNNGKSVGSTHTHSGVQSGGSTTGAPT